MPANASIAASNIAGAGFGQRLLDERLDNAPVLSSNAGGDRFRRKLAARAAKHFRGLLGGIVLRCRRARRLCGTRRRPSFHEPD